MTRVAGPSRAPRLDPLAVRRTLREAGIRPRHALSQNFLADVDTLEAILAEAAPVPRRRILEIGPGLGILTGGLIASGACVTAIELDRALAARLRVVFASEIERASSDPAAPGGLRVIEGDALDVDLEALVEPPFDVVANLPYHITSPILHRLLGQPPRPDRLVLMVQREVADRIAAAPGAMSYLSVFVQYHARVRLAFVVRSASFEPEPAVDSAVIVLDTRPDGPGGGSGPGGPNGGSGPGGRPEWLDPATEDELWRLVQASFRERRKMVHNVLSRQLPLEPGIVARALAEAGIAPDRRPQTLSVEEWLRLRETIGPLPVDRRGVSRPPEREAERPG